jgi:modulator of FtsH protease HflK
MSPRKPVRPEVIGPDGNPFDLTNVNVPFKLIAAGIVFIGLAMWFLFGGPFYTVEADEVGVLTTFGKYAASSPPGLHFKLPWPIQSVEKVNVQQVNRLEIGFRSQRYGNETSYTDFTQDRALLDEAQMLTGDENIINVSLAVQFIIDDERAYLFNYRAGQVERTLKDIAEAALRQAVGDHPIDAVLTSGKTLIRQEIHDKVQDLADEYETGVRITEVQLQDVIPPQEVRDAFQAVASAREMREQLINEARAYESEKLPRARGEAERVRLEARGYKESTVAQAQGEVARFKAITAEFEASPDVTRTRLYLEALNELLPNVKLTIVDDDAQLLNLKSLGGGVVNPAAPRVETNNE